MMQTSKMLRIYFKTSIHPSSRALVSVCWKLFKAKLWKFWNKFPETSHLCMYMCIHGGETIMHDIMTTLVFYWLGGWTLEVHRQTDSLDKCVLKCDAEQGPADVSSPLCCSGEGLFSQQISAQSFTEAAGMRLRTPRRRSDGFSQVRAAPGRPTHQL